MKEFTLRNKITEAKAEFLKKYGELDWRWEDEGRVYVLQDYHSSKGSIMDFTEDDWRVCKENGLSLEDVTMYCDERWFSEDYDNLPDALREFLDAWKVDHVVDVPDCEVPEDDVKSFVSDFFTWRKEILPKALAVYEEK